MWSSALITKGIRGGFEEYQSKVIEYLDENYPEEQLLITRLEDHKINNEYYQWFHLRCPLVREYGYGWDQVIVEDDEYGEYIKGGNHSEYVQIADWMHSLPKELKIAGCFDGECLEDLEIALNHLEIKFDKIHELIV